MGRRPKGRTVSKIRNFVVAVTTAVATAATIAVGMGGSNAPTAQAATCTPAKPNINCSKYWANRTHYAAKYNARNAAVTALQRSLTQAGFAVGATGHYNSYTVKAVRSYQASRGIPVTGALNYKTLTWLRVGAGPKRTVAPASTKATKAVQFAYAQIGKPYRYGGVGPSSYDCSGLTGASWKAAGVSLTRTSYGQLGKYKTVSKSSLKPGDIVGFYRGSHVGIYVGNGYVIHASRPGKPIAKVKMSSMPYYKAVRPVG